VKSSLLFIRMQTYMDCPNYSWKFPFWRFYQRGVK